MSEETAFLASTWELQPSKAGALIEARLHSTLRALARDLEILRTLSGKSLADSPPSGPHLSVSSESPRRCLTQLETPRCTRDFVP